jgi:hypothetical protein
MRRAQCAVHASKNEISGKIPVALGSGATAARHALDVKIGVRIPAPQQEKAQKSNSGLFDF